MAFSNWDVSHLVKFNSASSADFLAYYHECLDSKLQKEYSKKSHQTFAPSSMRCDRISWFRLRGVDPDTVKVPDRTLQFSADIGTACHRLIQTLLQSNMKEDWLDVSQYLKSLTTSRYNYHCENDSDSLETLVVVDNPPIRFACDGLIRWNGSLYLLEIKSSEFSAWDKLTKPKPHHIDQVNCYAELLELDKVLFLYIDRQYGSVKCFEHTVSDSDKQVVQSKFSRVMKCVETNLAPEGLPLNDSWCAPSYCPYYQKCKEYGR